MSTTSRYYQLIDGTTANMVGFFENEAELHEVLIEDLTEHGADSVRDLVLLIGGKTGPETTIAGDDLVRYAESLASASTRG